jgi:hypothetical protein
MSSSGIGGKVGWADSDSFSTRPYGKKKNIFAASPLSTRYSSANQGNVLLDPSIRGIQDTVLARNSALYSDLGEGGNEIIGNLRGTRSRFEGNQSSYLQSRINPVEQEFVSRQGDLSRSIGQRGLSGSSFGEQAITNLATDKQRTIGDTRAQAEMENLQALTGIDSQMAQTLFQKTAQQMQLNGLDLATAKERLQQELLSLGVGQQQIGLMATMFENWQRRLQASHQIDKSTSRQGEVDYKGGGGGGGIG